MCGLTGAEDTYEVLLSLAECLEKQGIKTSVISKYCHIKMLGNQYHSLNHIIGFKSFTEAEKIMALNFDVRSLEKSEMPALILMEAPDTVFRYNNIAPHGFGIQTYMLCQAVMPDYLICCVPCDLANEKVIAEINNDLSTRLGRDIDAVHVSNIIIDSADILQTKEISHVHVDISKVQEQINKQKNSSTIPLFDAITDGVDAISLLLCS